jgi:hypothetical protein
MACPTRTPEEAGRPSFDLTAYAEQPELVLVSLLSMMSAFPARHSAAIAESILGHLCLIADDERYAAPLRDCAVRLLETWDHLVELTQPDDGDYRLASPAVH